MELSRKVNFFMYLYVLYLAGCVNGFTRILLPVCFAITSLLPPGPDDHLCVHISPTYFMVGHSPVTTEKGLLVFLPYPPNEP